MTILDSIVDGVCVAKEKIVDVAQGIIEANRKNARLNRLRNIMKKENETMCKAYQALGKIYYEKMNEEEKKENQLFCNIIEKSQERLKRAHTKYREIANDLENESTQPDESISDKDLESLTVACSNEDEYNKNNQHNIDDDCNKNDENIVNTEQKETDELKANDEVNKVDEEIEVNEKYEENKQEEAAEEDLF